MNIDLVFPVLPPKIDGIGDYTFCLANALKDNHKVRILCSTPGGMIQGIDVLPSFDIESPSGILKVVKPVVDRAPDVVVLQYNPFSYGKWGYAPSLPRALTMIKRKSPRTSIAVMIHERWVDVTSWKTAIMTTWQRRTLRQLLAVADIIFVSTENWINSISKRADPEKIFHLPVGSNIPDVGTARDVARAELGVSDDTIALGVFGSAHPTRQFDFVQSALERLERGGVDFRILYVGPSADEVERVLSTDRLQTLGKLPPRDVSAFMSSLDIYLAPFAGGVAERRGSFLVGIQHGVPTVTTRGEQTPKQMLRATDAFWLTADDDSSEFADSVFMLANSPELRLQMTTKARNYFQNHHSWEGIAIRMTTLIEESTIR